MAKRLTLTLGLRLENLKVSSFRRDIQDYGFAFGFSDKIAPSLGASYDVFGDASASSSRSRIRLCKPGSGLKVRHWRRLRPRPGLRLRLLNPVRAAATHAARPQRNPRISSQRHRRTVSAHLAGEDDVLPVEVHH